MMREGFNEIKWIKKDVVEKEGFSWLEVIELKESSAYMGGSLIMGEGIIIKNQHIPSFLKGLSMMGCNDGDNFAIAVCFAPACINERSEEFVSKVPVEKIVFVAQMETLAFINLAAVPKEYRTKEWLALTSTNEEVE